MIGRVVLAALLAGIAAGFIMGAIQHVRITPLILEAEKYEDAMPAHDHGAAQTSESGQAVANTQPEKEEWQPENGLQRTALTTLASIMAGAGFAALLAGVSLLSGIPITPRNGLIWGLCGFLAVTVAPGADLPPELPGMPAGDLLGRQIWWLGTIAATGAGLYLIAARREIWAAGLAIALIALPHLIGAPQPASHETTVPAGLAAAFVSNTVAAAVVFWCLIGLFLGYALQRFSRDIHAT
jgi:cobalt transporter subunit CbtA